MKQHNCIWACGPMRRFVSPMIWHDQGEDIELVFNANGMMCDACGAVAIDQEEGNRIQRVIQELLR